MKKNQNNNNSTGANSENKVLPAVRPPGTVKQPFPQPGKKGLQDYVLGVIRGTNK